MFILLETQLYFPAVAVLWLSKQSVRSESKFLLIWWTFKAVPDCGLGETFFALTRGIGFWLCQETRKSSINNEKGELCTNQDISQT